ncbi:ADP-ribosylglycohydrolase family protein [Fodinicurvata sediminis]|uniref:ADP-ribosylglycohydrolase family protein n=1 Tax=Fodinicurvata sediminis TaxID=1121832 RepID=UPI0003B524D3|nr:ADP-ribosylglycohydrolase family protein [Fodinicurvata sediminis]
MLGAIAGDIIGSRFEGHPCPPKDFTFWHADCRFTDDSVCSLAVADAFLDQAHYAARLRHFVRRHPHAGYGGMFIRWAMTDDAGPYGSWGNGAPMRTAAIGWLADSEEAVLEQAAAQAAVSHDHPSAVAAAQAVSLAIFCLRKGHEPARVQQRLTEDFGYDLSPQRALRGGGFDVSAAGTLPPALTAAFTSESWIEAVRTAICLGGDTDTLACITGAVAEALYGLPDEVAAQSRDHLTPDLQDALTRFERACGR